MRSHYQTPTFLIAGSSASGTSFLSSILLQHPLVYLPRDMRPEPHFFYKSWEYSKGWDYYLERWFSQVSRTHVAIGERSSSYLFGGLETASKIYRHLPSVKLIFVLRNPIERTWANYRFTVLEGLENLSFEEALKHERTRIRRATGIWSEIQPHNYTGRGFYGSQVEEFLEVFPSTNILLIKSEELSRSTEQVVSTVIDFLGVPQSDWIFLRPPNFSSFDVIDRELQMRLRNELGKKFDEIIEAVRLNRLDEALPLLNSSERLLVETLAANLKSDKSELAGHTRSYLREIFSEDMKKLKKLVDFDISDWI